MSTLAKNGIYFDHTNFHHSIVILITLGALIDICQIINFATFDRVTCEAWIRYTEDLSIFWVFLPFWAEMSKVWGELSNLGFYFYRKSTSIGKSLKPSYVSNKVVPGQRWETDPITKQKITLFLAIVSLILSQ